MDDSYFDALMAEQYSPSLDHDLIDDEEDGPPEMLAPGGEPTPQSALEAALATGPIIAGDWWDTPLQLVEPAFLQVPGGKPLIYPNKSHSIVGEPGKGKTMLGQYLCVQEAAGSAADPMVSDATGYLTDELLSRRASGN
jgi:hypothetical protein